MAQSIDIPLQLQQTSNGLSLNINVGIGGQNPQSYIFDTGSPVFNAYYSASAFGSIPSNMSSPTALFPNGLPTGVQIDYGDGSAIFGNLVGVPSLTFYPTASTPGGSSTGVTLNAITPSGAPSAFIVNAIYKYQIPGGPSSLTPIGAIPGLYGGAYGIFGAGNFADYYTGANPGGGVTPNTTTTAVGGVLGQAVVPGTTAGYVVAANGQPLSAVPTGPDPQDPGATTNGPQVGQSVTSCSPCVMLGLTPALLAQFKPVDTLTAAASSPNFPGSNAPGSFEGGIDLTFTVSAPGQTSVTGTGHALLDTGTNAYYLYVSNPSAFSGFGSSDGSGGYNLNPGTTLTVAGTTSGATPSAITAFNESLYSVDVQQGNFDNIYGLGFFLQNSVMYNLAGEVIGYTPNFVTDTNITTTPAAPLVIDSNSVPLGLAGIISGAGGIFVNSGGSATLSGTNTYIGATAINGGYLALVGPGSISSSSGVGITGSGIFDISGVTNGATITSLSGDSSGFVSLGAQTLSLSAANGTFAGTIYGSGGLAVSGMLTLSGNNTYAGGTALASGTITVGTSSVGLPGAITSSPLGTGTLAMAAGTTLSFTSGSYTLANALTLSGDPTIMTTPGFTQTMPGAISDASGGAPAGALVVNGDGTVILSGANTYSGGTTICGTVCGTAGGSSIVEVGVATVGSPGAIISSAIGTGTLTLDGGTLQSEMSHTFTIANAVQIDSTGGTIDGNGTNLTLSGNITNGNATTGTLTIENTINGAPVLFSGANTYSGPTNIISGGLGALSTTALSPNSAFQVNTGTNLFLNGFSNTMASLADGTGGGGTVQNGSATAAALTIAPTSGTTTFSGTIEDGIVGGAALSIIKSGAGTQVFSGTSNTYTGTTTINGGILEVDGSIATSSLTSVNNTGMLDGVGTVGATQVNSGGTLAPGSNAPGTFMTVVGNLTLATGAFYMVQVNPATASYSTVTGTATLSGATVDAAFALVSGYVSKQYTILTATGGLTNTTFAGLANANLPSGATDSLSYSTNDDDVYLNLVAPFTNYTGLNGNQQTVANALTTDYNTNGGILAKFFNLSPAQLTQIDGEAATGAEHGAFQLMSDFLNLMLDPAGGGGGGSAGGGATGFAPEQDASLPPEIALAYNSILAKAPPKPQNFDQRWSAWGSAFGGTANVNGDPAVGSTNVTANDFGYAGGMDYHLSRDSLVGFALAGGGTNWSLAQNLGGGRSDAFQGGLYAKTHSGPWYASAAIAFANHWFTTDRTSALGDQLQAKFQGQSVGGRLEAGYRYGLPSTDYLVGFTPYAAVQAQSFHTPTYSETDLTAGGFGLTYNAHDATDTRSELGARFDDLITLNNLPLILRARLAWAHDWISNPALGAVFQALPGSNFIVNGAAPPHDSALTTLGAELRMTANWSLLGKFDGEFGTGAQTYAGTGTLRYIW